MRQVANIPHNQTPELTEEGRAASDKPEQGID